MVLKLDPGIPLVWRDPFNLQFGVDPARLVLREVTNAQEHMIAALATGVSRSGLSMIAQSAGGDEREVEKLLAALAPSLLATTLDYVRPAVSIVGSGSTVDRIASAIAETGALVEVGPTVSDTPCDFGISVGHFVLEPQTYGFWLRRDLPHLAVTFGVGQATVGPLIEPGAGPCLYCLEHHRRDLDPSWAAISSQLWGRRSSAETPLLSREVAALASRLVFRRLEIGRQAGGGAATSFRLSARTGDVTRREWMPHPDCGCHGIPTAVRRENDWAGESRRGADLPRPRRAGAAAGLA
jgi:bacteriocin biosynthesis cyclodehydratase domain-containing protein